MVAIVDYNMGNLRSVQKAFEYIGANAIVSNRPKDLEDAERIVLPGVGTFGDGMKNLKSLGLIDVLKEQITVRKKPFLGICLGMQLLAKKSYEFGEFQGLSLIDAQIIKLSFVKNGLRVPHVGWDSINILKENSLTKHISNGDDFYFVHSYYMQNNDCADIVAICDYGIEFSAAIMKENIFATQFHPEKSQGKGLDILSEFVKWRPFNA